MEKDLDPAEVFSWSDESDKMEGLYLKVESDGEVVERFKWVRHGFLQTVAAADNHWLDRPVVPNLLAADVEIFNQ